MRKAKASDSSVDWVKKNDKRDRCIRKAAEAIRLTTIALYGFFSLGNLHYVFTCVDPKSISHSFGGIQVGGRRYNKNYLV